MWSVVALALLGIAPRGPHLEVGQLKLEPFARPAVLASPSPRQRPSLATPSMTLGGGSALASFSAQRARQRSNSGYLGDTWSLGHGREFSLHFTPNQGHCAPLMRLTF